MKDENCIFCKLANGEIATNTLYEDDMFRVILDNGPASKGHALILPKQHFKNIYEIDEETVMKGAALARKMSIKLTNLLNCDGFNILQNNGEAAGQTVFHYHIHLIPRYKGDEEHLKICWEHQNLTEEDIKQLVEAFRE